MPACLADRDHFLEPGWEEALLCVPELLRAEIIGYALSGQPTGPFLRAVLANDLHEAVRRMDPPSFEGLRALCRFIYCYCPSHSWGSYEAVKAWTRREED